MQWDPECSSGVVYFHKNIPGVDSYSLVWSLGATFPDCGRGEELPPLALIGRERRRRGRGHVAPPSSELKICTLAFRRPLLHVARREMSREEPDRIETRRTAEHDPGADPWRPSPELAIVFKEFGFRLQGGLSQYPCPCFSQQKRSRRPGTRLLLLLFQGNFLVVRHIQMHFFSSLP